jgi:hypothetical protein
MEDSLSDIWIDLNPTVVEEGPRRAVVTPKFGPDVAPHIVPTAGLGASSDPEVVKIATRFVTVVARLTATEAIQCDELIPLPNVFQST